METWTIQRLLTWVTGYLTDKKVDAPRLSAELLLGHVLSLKRIELYTKFDRPVDKAQLDQLRPLVKRAGEHEPVVYLVGRTEFYGIELAITPDCLIPRPETELLAARAIEFLRGRRGPQRVCDLCAGSGCLAVAIARNHADATVTATDLCARALSVAATNVDKHKLAQRVTLLCGDLFDPLIAQLDGPGFDLIVCNPPYVSTREYEMLDRNVREYEPPAALLAGEDGLDVYRRICAGVGPLLRPDGALMLEIGYAQGPAVREMLERTDLFQEVAIEKDAHDNDRVVLAHRGRRKSAAAAGLMPEETAE